MTDISVAKLRLDKWLWAARFFKTRSLAKAAIEGGKVHLGGQRVKVSKEISVGDTLQIRQGWDERIVVVQGLAAAVLGVLIGREGWEGWQAASAEDFDGDDPDRGDLLLEDLGVTGDATAAADRHDELVDARTEIGEYVPEFLFGQRANYSLCELVEGKRAFKSA